jgi:hypothetical protein
MLRNPAVIGASARSSGKAVHSVSCLAFVAILAAAFWAGALWIGETLLRILMVG